MAIPDYARANFDTLVKAARAGDLERVEWTEGEKSTNGAYGNIGARWNDSGPTSS